MNAREMIGLRSLLLGCGANVVFGKTRSDDVKAQSDLFAPPLETPAPVPDALKAALAALDPDQLAPREALDALYRLKRLSIQD